MRDRSGRRICHAARTSRSVRVPGRHASLRCALQAMVFSTQLAQGGALNKMSTRLYFPLDHLDPYHRADWEDRLSGWLAGCNGQVERVSQPDDAEFILESTAAHSFTRGRTFRVAPDSLYPR